MDDLWLKQSGNRKISLPEWQELCQQCQRCSLREGARNVVFGEGNPQAKLIFIGEGPGAEEDRLGRPFVGAAGRLLDHILAAGGWSREEISIANVVTCRPPGNRPPKRTEIQSCLPLLQKQLAPDRTPHYCRRLAPVPPKRCLMIPIFRSPGNGGTGTKLISTCSCLLSTRRHFCVTPGKKSLSGRISSRLWPSIKKSGRKRETHCHERQKEKEDSPG